MVDSHQVKNGCVEVMDMNGILDRVPSKLIGGAVGNPALDAPRRKITFRLFR